MSEDRFLAAMHRLEIIEDLSESEGFKLVEEQLESEIRTLRNHMERDLDFDKYNFTRGQISGIRKLLSVVNSLRADAELEATRYKGAIDSERY